MLAISEMTCPCCNNPRCWASDRVFARDLTASNSCSSAFLSLSAAFFPSSFRASPYHSMTIDSAMLQTTRETKKKRIKKIYFSIIIHYFILLKEEESFKTQENFFYLLTLMTDLL